ncbi:MAG: lytic murein transglycosylase [Gaiellaceae bacterium]
MKRTLASAAIALVLAGGARAGTFASTPGAAPLSPVTTQAAVPSASLPNGSDVLRLPEGWMQQARSVQPLGYEQLLGLWQGAAAAYGVPWQVLAAINKVESNFGRNMGPSSAGAIGWMQFMPSTWLRWGWDFDGDGYADPWSPTDAIYSAARYLAAAGGATDVEGAVYSYNHAQWYVNEVVSLAQVFGSDPSVTFELDGLQISLQHAEQRLARASVRLNQAASAARALRSTQRALDLRAQRTALVSDRGPLRMRAVQVSAQAAQVEARLPGLRDLVERARSALAVARRQALSASFNPVTAPLLASPSYGSGGYVFPVGGGASNISVAQTHHDYPAADIAAPTGSPVYALTNAVVTNAWEGIDPSCGIGLTMRADDGQVWTYCHLSYREPSVRAGARLPAGVEIGLVGSTGDATGPHLHLQLQPPAVYPQSEPWFRSFAGLAYQWADSSPLTLSAAGTGPTFAMVGGSPLVEPALPTLFTVATPSSPAPEQTVVPRVAAARVKAHLSVGGPRPVFGLPPGATPVRTTPQKPEEGVIEFSR